MKIESSFFLVGPMGAGKTTIGSLLASQLTYNFLDADHVMVERLGVSIPTIFELEGEDGFRRRETQILQELVLLPKLILATGGGVVLRPKNRCLLKKGLVIYLKIAPQAQFQRIKNDRNRPLLQTDNPEALLYEMNKIREPLYSEVADLVIDVAEKKAHIIVQEILDKIANR